MKGKLRKSRWPCCRAQEQELAGAPRTAGSFCLDKTLSPCRSAAAHPDLDKSVGDQYRSFHRSGRGGSTMFRDRECTLVNDNTACQTHTHSTVLSWPWAPILHPLHNPQQSVPKFFYSKG